MSKLNTFSDGFKVLRTIARLFRDYKPFAFFGWLGLICFAIATAFFAPVLSGYLATGMVPKFPTLIACSGLYVISFLLWISGTLALFPEASAGCFFRTFCTVTHDVDFPSGTKHIFIVSTGCCGTF